jgi:hypothetical protein
MLNQVTDSQLSPRASGIPSADVAIEAGPFQCSPTVWGLGVAGAGNLVSEADHKRCTHPWGLRHQLPRRTRQEDLVIACQLDQSLGQVKALVTPRRMPGAGGSGP